MPAATANTSASTADNPLGTGLLAFASCMRSHGVPGFPDPSGSGGVPKAAVISAMQAAGDTKAEAAQTACNPLLPSGGLSGQASPDHPHPGSAGLPQGGRLHALARHPQLPRPDLLQREASASTSLPASTSTPRPIAQARQTCEQLIPAGLPDSGRSG